MLKFGYFRLPGSDPTITPPTTTTETASATAAPAHDPHPNAGFVMDKYKPGEPGNPWVQGEPGITWVQDVGVNLGSSFAGTVLALYVLAFLGKLRAESIKLKLKNCWRRIRKAFKAAEQQPTATPTNREEARL
ncbi:Oidioi.mRNA.OKI2018_I69.chr1.g1237.t1.cds [Oikopleura dioica]|uniref:Oidioi.mRNA.OKI2018_I69.chr1.g1237.t1.cds n=1 Tax=Oikopleura dioica TaxID=34765 RepID=A0ABN7SWI5_OIKDI|nr:Oidioi.mRNA.OKI2018_I69.chr1.g1237.t1.cds [Oikopleura dioica]